MKFKNFKLFVVILLFSTTAVISLNHKRDFRVLHAGGWHSNNTKGYSNSILALSLNKEKSSFFELDLQITRDNRLVCLHDPNIDHLFYNQLKKRVNKKLDCFDQSLFDFLEKNKHVNIITDFKSDNIKGLTFLKEYGFNIDRIYPQIYNLNNYERVKKIGYKKIIFTLYRVPSNKINQNLINKILSKDLYAVTMNPPLLRKGFGLKIKEKNKNIIIYTYTVNSYYRLLMYKLLFGTDEIYTDMLF